MALYETVGSLIIILLALGVIVLISVMIRKLRREKSGLESLQAANNRKVLIKLNSACTIIDRFIQKSPDPAQLIEIKNRLSTLNPELLKSGAAKFNKQAGSLDQWNAAEKAIIDNSEKLALELERQLTVVPDIAAIEKHTDMVSNAILNRITEQEWHGMVSNLLQTEENTKEIDMPAETLFTMISRIIKDMHMLSPEVTQTPQIFDGVARFYGVGVKELKYAAQAEVVGGARKAKLIMRAWEEKEDALTGFYHGILDEIEKRINVKGYIDEPIVQHFNIAGHYVTGQVGRIIDVGDRSVPDREQVER